MSNPESRSTATAENAMSERERDAFLTTAGLSRLSTLRADGFAHTTPCWFLWQDGVFVHSIGAGRMHLRNVRRNLKVTECVDIDERPEHGLGARAAAVVCFGEAEVIEDQQESVEWSRRVLARYFAPDAASSYLEHLVADVERGRRAVIVRPHRFVTWDYAKVR
jgi:nitroimidazol reductase NimA-like FMN-containing flavoprotein (pyridoxamine 5'-phosphate oxidase superfamily)